MNTPRINQLVEEQELLIQQRKALRKQIAFLNNRIEKLEEQINTSKKQRIFNRNLGEIELLD